MSLVDISLYDLNLTANCSNLHLGINVWLNDFILSEPSPGNSGYDNDTYYNDTADSGPWDDAAGSNDYYSFWTNGTSPEWLAFWRYGLASVLPETYLDLSDQEVSDWSNSTDMFSFFTDWAYDDYQLVTPDAKFPPWLSKFVAQEGGCNPLLPFNASDDLIYMARGCMIQYCCSSDINATVAESSTASFPYYSNWSVQDACSFNTCQRSNNGNPDLGGIGVLVAYIIEGSLLAFIIIMFSIRSFTDYWSRRHPEKKARFLKSHNSAVLASSGVFIDTSVFFALSICFAAIIFNYRDTPLLYEDKLGQASTLLTIDAPIGVLLLTYRDEWLERRTLRIFIVLLTALMTFIIQFMFRRATSFNPTANLCLNWDDRVEGFFRDRFYVKAVWAFLVFVFFLWKMVPWHILRKPEHVLRLNLTVHPKLRFWNKLPGWNRMVTLLASLKVRKIWDAIKHFHWESFIAYVLAVYALYDTFYDIRFLIFLRRQEATISKNDSENNWGYGQILAIFVWAPVIVEYTFTLGMDLGFYKAFGRHMLALGCSMGLYAKPEHEDAVEHEYQMVEHGHIESKGEEMIEPHVP